MKNLKSTQKRLIQYLYSINSPFSIIELADAFNCHYNTIYNILKVNNTNTNVKINSISSLSDSNSNVKINNLLTGDK